MTIQLLKVGTAVKNIMSSADEEYEQSIIRILLGSMVILYLLLFTPYQNWMPFGFGGFLIISFLLSAIIKNSPGRYPWRIVTGQIVDFGSISINILMCGELALPVLGVYLWVIIGNGCRFGLPYLISAISISTIFYSIVGLNEPFLAEHKYLTIGIGITQMFVPFYFAVLLQRLNETRDRLEFLSDYDELTGLLNRRKFGQLIQGEFERLHRTPAPFAIAMIDIDHFKAINDTLGHLAGDQVLRAVAESMKKSCRSVDSVSRYGGEEFAILLPGMGNTESFSLGDRIRENIAQSAMAIENMTCHVTVSVGVACWNDKYERVEDWIKAADDVLYSAKKGGRNMVVIAPGREDNMSTPVPIIPDLT